MDKTREKVRKIIKESFEADIIGVKGNPLEDITSLEDVEFVMNNGIIIKQ